MNDPKQQLPTAGIVLVDGAPATSVRYARNVNDDGVSYNLTFRLGDKVVGTVKSLSLAEMDEAIGETNADSIHRQFEGKGSLRGADLAYHYGTTEQGREQVRQVEREAAAAGSIADLPEGIALALKLGISPEELDARIRKAHEQEQAIASTATSVVARHREAAAPEKDPTAAETAAEQMAETARRESEQTRLRKEVEKQYLLREGNYYYKDKNNQLAIQDRGHKLVSADTDERVAASMAKLVEAKGWDSVKVSGPASFQRSFWLAASSRGIEVQGYRPTEADRAALDARIEATMRSSVERGARQRSEPTPEQVEADRKRKQQSEDYNLLRPGAQQSSGRAGVIEAVAAAVAEQKIRNPATREKFQSEVRQRLEQAQSKGAEHPNVQTYDKDAPTKRREPEKSAPQVNRDTERTR